MIGTLKIVYHTFTDRFTAPVHHAGDAKEICESIIESNWNGTFYQTGSNHFAYFWIRDFGTVAEALCRLGHTDRVHSTISWALGRYLYARKITTCLASNGEAFDAPRDAIDSLPWLVHSIVATAFPLSQVHRTFLSQELAEYCKRYLDPKTGAVRKGIRYCEIRDAAKYKQSAYALSMLALLVKDLQALEWNIPIVLTKQNYAQILEEQYWNGSYLNADIDNQAFTAEGNLFPFWLGVLADTAKERTMLESIHARKLSEPFPLKYTNEPRAFSYRWWVSVIMPNYAGDTIWPWHGAIYVILLKRTGSPAFEFERRKLNTLIERYGTFPELLNPDGSWYKTLFYQSERGMIWAAIYLELLKQ